MEKLEIVEETIKSWVVGLLTEAGSIDEDTIQEINNNLENGKVLENAYEKIIKLMVKS